MSWFNTDKLSQLWANQSLLIFLNVALISLCFDQIRDRTYNLLHVCEHANHFTTKTYFDKKKIKEMLIWIKKVHLKYFNFYILQCMFQLLKSILMDYNIIRIYYLLIMHKEETIKIQWFQKIIFCNKVANKITLFFSNSHKYISYNLHSHKCIS